MVAKLLAQGESQTREFKASFQEETLETIGAFANAQGGEIIIGILPDGVISGISVGKKSLEDWANRIKEATDPRIQPSITIVEEKNKKLAVIKVEPSLAGLPVSVKGRFFKRVGRTNQRMSHDEIMRRLLASSGSSWDAEAEHGTSFADLDQKQIAFFIRQVKKIGRRPIPKETDNRVILEKLNLLKNGVPTRAALLLLGKQPTRHFPSAYMKLGRFRSPIHIVDDKRVDGTILTQIDETMSWFRERFETEFVITGKPQRDVIWEYPLDAVREAVINAVCHRDYRMNINIQVRLYDDHLEIWNAGGLPTELTPANLLQDHDSIPRNTLLAECLFYCGLIESWGSGTTRIAKLLIEAGLSLPEFNTTHTNRLRVIFHKTRFSKEQLHKLGLNERQISGVQHIRNNGRIANQEYQNLLGVSDRTATRELNQLVDLGILSRHGITGKGTYYALEELIKPTHDSIAAKAATKAPQSRHKGVRKPPKGSKSH